MLEAAIRRYQNRTIEAAQVIEELIELAKEMREDLVRGEELGLNEDELAFYDVRKTNDRPVTVLGDEDPSGPSRRSWLRRSGKRNPRASWLPCSTPDGVFVRG